MSNQLSINYGEPIRLTGEGEWYQGSVEITHERTKELFFKSLIYKDGQYYLTGEKEPVPVVVEDAAYFVRQLEKGAEGYQIALSDGTRETLDVASLNFGSENELYCRSKNGTAKAKFLRPVFYELMQGLVEREGYLGLLIGEMFYPLKGKPETVIASEEPSEGAPRATVGQEAGLVVPIKRAKPVSPVMLRKPGEVKRPKLTAKKPTAKKVAWGKTKKAKARKKPALRKKRARKRSTLRARRKTALKAARKVLKKKAHAGRKPRRGKLSSRAQGRKPRKPRKFSKPRKR